jgi:hypothetical protein
MNDIYRRIIPSNQDWYWVEDWQAGEREATAQITAGDTRIYGTTEEFLAYLEDARSGMIDNRDLAESEWLDQSRAGFVLRHVMTITLTVLGVVWIASALFPTVSAVRNLIALIAVLVTTTGALALFTYLIGTTLRQRLRVRRGEVR